MRLSACSPASYSTSFTADGIVTVAPGTIYFIAPMYSTVFGILIALMVFRPPLKFPLNPNTFSPSGNTISKSSLSFSGYTESHINPNTGYSVPLMMTLSGMVILPEYFTLLSKFGIRIAPVYLYIEEFLYFGRIS
ncbi:unknown [Prevotella sp. CAG:873]|nr:unknown [Prevotella sp. CAG:873]